MKGTLALTGATGLVGGAVLKQALADGWSVRALTRRAMPEQEGVTWVAGSLDDPASLAELVSGTDAVIHVAGVVNAPDAEGFEAGNVAGTRAMVEAAQVAGVRRFVHTSSLTAREPDLSNYGASKARAEAIVEASGLDWTIIRPPAVYGPNDTDMLDLFRMAKWGFVLLPPYGRLSLIEVSDLAKLLLAAVPARECIGAVYEADDGAPDGWTHKGMGRAIGWAVDREILPLPMPKFVLVAAAAADRLFRRSGAKLTRDRVNYMCHPDWTIDPARRPPPSVWEPHMNTRSGLKLAARAYRIKGWL